LLIDIEGDMEAFLVAMQVPWILRRAISALGYGKGKFIDSLTFAADGGKMTYATKRTPKDYSWTAVIDGVTETTMSEGVVLLRWDGDTLILKTTRQGKPDLFGTRTIDGDTQLNIVTCNGATVTKIFTKST